MRVHSTIRLILLTIFISSAAATGDRAAEKPGPDAIVIGPERVKLELLQIDLSITGPAEAIGKLEPSTLRVAIGARKFRVAALDRVCSTDPPPANRPSSDRASTIALDATHSSFLFYFDQPHLTPQGRERALDLARDLVTRLVRDGNRAMIASAARDLQVLVDWTDDPDVLIDGISRLRADPHQFDEYPAQEEQRIAFLQSVWEVGYDWAGNDALIKGAEAGRPIVSGGADLSSSTTRRIDMFANIADFRRGAALATVRLTQNEFRKDEEHHTRSALSRFSTLLPRLSAVDAPKAVLYFADTVRANPGEHYMALFKPTGWEFGDCGKDNPVCHITVGSVVPEFQRVIDLAFTYGVRLYTVQAQGLVDESGPNIAARNNAALLSGPTAMGQRFIDSKKALVAFALETGGQAFLNGVGADEMARRIDRDLSCIYVVSVDPEGLARDQRLKLKISTSIAGVSIRSRSSVILLSDEARRRSRLENAAFETNAADQEETMRLHVIPTGFSGRGFRGLVQVVLPPFHEDGGAWEVGITLDPAKGKTRQVSRRVQLSQTGVPVVFETELEFPPAAYVLTAVARQTPGDFVISHRAEGVWPERRSTDVFVGPRVLIQPAQAAFVRDDAVRKEGSLARDRAQWIDPALPVALVGFVCSGAEGWSEGAAVRRQLIGAGAAPFEVFRPDPETRCALYRDVVPPGMLTSGGFTYEVAVVNENGDPLATGSDRFTVVSREFLASVTEEGP